MPQTFIVHVPVSVRKHVDQIPFPWRDRIYQVFEALQTEPFYGEKMMGKYKDTYKVRVWPYRVLYRVNKKKRLVIIDEAGHRGSMGY